MGPGTYFYDRAGNVRVKPAPAAQVVPRGAVGSEQQFETPAPAAVEPVDSATKGGYMKPAGRMQHTVDREITFWSEQIERIRAKKAEIEKGGSYENLSPLQKSRWNAAHEQEVKAMNLLQKLKTESR